MVQIFEAIEKSPDSGLCIIRKENPLETQTIRTNIPLVFSRDWENVELLSSPKSTLFMKIYMVRKNYLLDQLALNCAAILEEITS